jgi:hypothetical protein
MPIHIVTEPARERHFASLRHAFVMSGGIALVLVGWAALPALGVLYIDRREQGHSTAARAGHGTVVTVVAVLVALLFLGPFVGRRLVRRSRRLVLFLRRFGYSEATHALTFAALTTIGGSWRLVTLDDAAVAPVGFSRGMEKVFAAGEVGSKVAEGMFGRLQSLALLTLWSGVAGMGAVSGYTSLHHHSGLAVAGKALGLGHHHHHASQTAAGYFRLFFVVTIVAALAMLAGLVVGIAARVLLMPWMSFSSALRQAEKAKVTRVDSLDRRHDVAHDVRRQARRVFSPRLIVLHVANEVWRPIVKSFAEIASVVLIDVSVLTENLLWEIAEVVHDPDTACVLVGHAEGLRDLEVIDTPLERQLVELLDGRTILAYETSEQGMQQFARALRATLEVAVA